jgi:hypothetical protein
MRPLPLERSERVPAPLIPTLERTCSMLIAIIITAAATAVVLAGALVASDTSRTNGTDTWMLNGPHSLH